MKRALLILAVALLLPGVLSAQDALVGVFFDVPPGEAPSVMHYYPEEMVAFTGYLYSMNADYYITGIEYQLQTPMDPTHIGIMLSTWEVPEGALQIGNPFDGHAIAFWPPLNGYMPGYNLMATYTFYAACGCFTGAIEDYPMTVGPHPVSGELWGTYSPDDEYFYPIGLTSIICPVGVANQEESWGAIKSLYR
jgi:hypothetical protein